jgi:transposase
MGNPSGRRFRTKQERLQIVEETLKPGVSVAVVARAHGVNANQVFTWRRLYRQGYFDEATSATALVPVKVSTASNKTAVPTIRRRLKLSPSTAGTIEIDLGHARVRIEGADPDCVRAAIEGLVR